MFLKVDMVRLDDSTQPSWLRRGEVSEARTGWAERRGEEEKVGRLDTPFRNQNLRKGERLLKRGRGHSEKVHGIVPY